MCTGATLSDTGPHLLTNGGESLQRDGAALLPQRWPAPETEPNIGGRSGPPPNRPHRHGKCTDRRATEARSAE